ncbi:MAG TPA: SRPBCC domain-containing protein [Bacillales bacterium]|nr:SRPBCC domain-containing protein [Bacillales bacterium]
MVKVNPSGNITSTVKERSFTLERIFDAPRELIFKAFTKPEYVSRWWAPGSYTIPVCNIDLRPGGIWHYCMESPEGERHWAMSVYREIDDPERLVYTGCFADEEANPIDGIPEHLVTVTLDEHEGKTKVTIHVELGSAKELEATLNMGMKEGLTMCVDQNLVKVLENMQ